MYTSCAAYLGERDCRKYYKNRKQSPHKYQSSCLEKSQSHTAQCDEEAGGRGHQYLWHYGRHRERYQQQLDAKSIELETAQEQLQIRNMEYALLESALAVSQEQLSESQNQVATLQNTINGMHAQTSAKNRDLELIQAVLQRIITGELNSTS